jgi:hypothetical protein
MISREWSMEIAPNHKKQYKQDNVQQKNNEKLLVVEMKK